MAEEVTPPSTASEPTPTTASPCGQEALVVGDHDRYRDIQLGHLFARLTQLTVVIGKALEMMLDDEAADRAEQRARRAQAEERQRP